MMLVRHSVGLKLYPNCVVCRLLRYQKDRFDNKRNSRNARKFEPNCDIPDHVAILKTT